MNVLSVRLRPAHTLSCLAGLALTVGSAHAQWSFVNLSPPTLNDSSISSVVGGVPVGQATSEGGGSPRAGYWTGSLGSSFVSLQPAGAEYSSVTGSNGTSQVGYAVFGGSSRAGRWTGTAASWADLTPVAAGATSSVASGLDGNTAVGSARFGGTNSRAGLWSGGADTWTSLHPAGSVDSAALGGGGGQQTGYADFAGTNHAGLWTGTSDSWVDLHPTGSIGSEAYDTDGFQQVGGVRYATEAGFTTHAGLWSGTAGSYVNLHPVGASSSVARDVWNGWQVGNAWIGGDSTAGIWNSTAESWFDLGGTLPPFFSLSSASSIWSDGSTIFVGGVAFNNVTNGYDAILWTTMVPAPGAATVLGLTGLMAARRRR